MGFDFSAIGKLRKLFDMSVSKVRFLMRVSYDFTPINGKLYILDKPEVMALLDQAKNPFPQRPPKFIRSKLYKYHFTKSAEDTDWWTREEVGEYSPVFSKDDPPQGN